MSGNFKELAARYNVRVPSQIDGKAKIMVIEDQQDLRMIVAHQLQKLSFPNVIQKTNGYDALEYLREQGKVDMFLCDMDMPVMGGLDLLQEIRESVELDHAPFCLMMDNVSKEKLMLAVESGVDEILVKPFTLGDIGPKMKAAFRKFHIPSNPEKVYDLAKMALREESLELASSVYTDLSLAAPKAARPLVGLARIAIARGDLDEAMNRLQEAEHKNASFVHLFTERARVFSLRQQWSNAVACFEKAISLSPLNAIRYKQAADVMFKVKKYEEAATMLEMALKNDLDFPDLYHYLSQAKFALKDYTLAAKYIKMALHSDSENVTYLNQLGICQKELGNVDEAQRIYNQIIKLDPTNAAALYNKAILLHAKGQTEEAIKLLERLVRKQPDFALGKAKLDEYKKGLSAA